MSEHEKLEVGDYVRCIEAYHGDENDGIFVGSVGWVHRIDFSDSLGDCFVHWVNGGPDSSEVIMYRSQLEKIHD